MIPLLVAYQQPVFDFDVKSGAGLSITVKGTPVVRGSWIQYFEAGWSRGYYSSTYQPATVKRIDADTMEATFTGAEGRVSGTQTYHRDGDKLSVRNHFEWSGDTPVFIEACVGQVWAPAFEQGVIRLDGVPGRDLTRLPAPKSEMSKRLLGPDASKFEFDAPFANVGIHSTIPLTMFDARNGYDQDFAEGKQLFWTGAMTLQVAKEKPVDFTVEWRLQPNRRREAPAKEVRLAGKPTEAVLTPSEERHPLVPKPTDDELNWDKPAEFTMRHHFPAGRFRFYDELVAAIHRRFETSAPTNRDTVIDIDGGVSHMNLAPGGYRIEIKNHSVSVLGEEEEGLHIGLERLAQLLFIKDGKLMLPSGTLVDNPKTGFRGVHLFVGRKSVDFQKKLWERVLRPLGMNTVVLQCERTKWDALEGAHSAIAMEKSDLAALFNQYRALGIEPVPLIQSFGHMEWFFANGKRLDLAFNPKVPYAIDPRKPEAREKIAQIWDEAIALLKPRTIHFGLDEVDMLGHEKHDPALVTEMWKVQLPFLGTIAKRHSVQMMLWGDKGLAPGEAPDAALGDNKADAEARRRAIPKGSLIADWHYKADARPKTFYPVLQLWKREGFRPIASAWYRPENVRGFNLAATYEQVGTLQTTWAGYESDEEAMLKAMNQFSAMVLAADYSWSGREDALDKLGYDPAEVLRRLYFGRPSPLKPVAGITYGDGESLTVEGLAFRKFTAPLELATAIATDDGNQSSALSLTLDRPAADVSLLVDTRQKCDDGDPVAEVTLYFDNGGPVTNQLIYGRHVRQSTDLATTPLAPRRNGLGAVRFTGFERKKVTKIEIRPLSTYAGLRVFAVTTLGNH